VAFTFDRGEEGDAFKSEEVMSADAMPKYVVSSTLTDASWNNSTILRGDPVQEVTRLKERAGEILVAGSGRLVSALHTAGLGDGYRLMVFPIVVGGGLCLFDGVGMPALRP
jgi:dihydrofolate reductase